MGSNKKSLINIFLLIGSISLFIFPIILFLLQNNENINSIINIIAIFLIITSIVLFFLYLNRIKVKSIAMREIYNLN